MYIVYLDMKGAEMKLGMMRLKMMLIVKGTVVKSM